MKSWISTQARAGGVAALAPAFARRILAYDGPRALASVVYGARRQVTYPYEAADNRAVEGLSGPAHRPPAANPDKDADSFSYAVSDGDTTTVDVTVTVTSVQ